jgi:hypothetical protein
MHTYTYRRTYVHIIAPMNILSLSSAYIVYRDSRRSSLGSCYQGSLYSLKPCPNTIHYKDNTERYTGGKSREQGSCRTNRSDFYNSILDCFFKGIRTTKDSAQAAHTPLCSSTTPGSPVHSICDVKHTLTPLYLNHSKDLDNDDDKRGFINGGLNQEFSSDLNIATQQLRITKKRDRKFSLLTMKTRSRYNSYSYNETTESCNVLEKARQ